MAVLSLPLSFNNSFWTQDYRKGLEVLYAKLEQGVAENDEIVAFVRARAIAENMLADSLISPMLTGRKGTGFDADDGASLLMAFRGLQEESVKQGKLHASVANELQTLVADPFEEWANGYKERLRQNRHTVVDGWLRSYEHAQTEVTRLKNQYLSKTRKADEAEDEFAPRTDFNDKYTTSPRLGPRDSHRSPPERTPSVSERIAQRLKEIQRKSASSAATRQESHFINGDEKKTTGSPERAEEEDEDDKPLLPPKVDKGKGKAVEVEGDEKAATPPRIASPPPLSPQLPPTIDIPPPSSPMPPAPPSPLIIAGLSLPATAISDLLSRAASELPLRPIRFPILGEYPDCFTGEEFVNWLNEHVQVFGGSVDKAEEAARELAEREGLLRRVGEFGNMFENADDAFYQFRPKAFTLGKIDPHHPPKSPVSASPGSNLAPIANNLVQRSGTFVNLVQRALNANNNGEPAFIRLRQEAEAADKEYRVAVRKLDRQRLGLEERMEDTLKGLQRWEADRLRAVKTVLLQYQGTLSNLPKSFTTSLETQATLLASYQPESDLTGLIERYRTGPFRPAPQLYESIAHDESDVVFGIDLRKWAEGGWNAIQSGEERGETVPPVVSVMLHAMKEAYGKLPDDAEKRKSWIYEVPLKAVHHLRENINAIPPEQPLPTELFARYDAPVIASAIKLWMLELDPPLGLWEGWDDIRKIYPTVGHSAKTEGEATHEQHIQELSSTLLRLPRVHLFVLDAIISHLRNLLDTTTTDEPNEVFITKLALSMGRTIIRPKYESQLSIQDRHPTLLFIDLLTYYGEILPPTVAHKKRESERKVPIRKRTAPVDMRMGRGNRISVSGGVLAAQERARKEVPPVPPVPAAAQQTASEISKELPAEPATVPAVTEEPKSETVAPASESTPAKKEEPEPQPEPEPEAAKAAEPEPEATSVPEPAPVPAEDSGLPPRPSFREPPPEEDDLPPRPSFKEPPPEEDDAVPPMPNFSEPPPEPEEGPKSPPSAPLEPSPASPRATSLGSASPASPVSGPRSRTSSPSISEDQSVSGHKSTLSRSGSNETSRVRGPRISRGPRAPGGGSVSSIVQNFNRTSMTAASPTSPGIKSNRFSTPGSPGSRPSSVAGGASARRDSSAGRRIS